MGWTHDFRDVARNRSHPKDPRTPGSARLAARMHGDAPEPGIPHLLRRRARWVGARLRHTRP